ncbi:MAG TPA: squalene synthase HpnC [Vicinamibacterales bacterium]|nr:squalene synthase HpnC [Vicinamibacterales bacterium]
MVSDAYAACLEIAHAHYENFPVASRLVPASLRPHLAAVYAFARGADDIADEPGRTQAERLALLDEWSAHLRGAPRSAVFEALAETRRRFDLPLDLFDDLLSAFKQDVEQTRYDTWEEVFDYCRRSANPVGRLVLRLAGVRRPDADAWSDDVCTALQLTNFWQDLAIDWQRGRLYVPHSVWVPAGAETADLGRGVISEAWRRALRDCASVTEDRFRRGRPVCDVLRGRLRYELRATWLGGLRVLQKTRELEFDVFQHRPTLGAADALVIAWKALTWPATPRSTTPS